MGIMKRELTITIMDVDISLERNGKTDYLNGIGSKETNHVLLSTNTLAQHLTSETLFHEVLHTMGLKHCSKEKCLMNFKVKNNVSLCNNCENELERSILVQMRTRLKDSKPTHKNGGDV